LNPELRYVHIRLHPAWGEKEEAPLILGRTALSLCKPDISSSCFDTVGWMTAMACSP